MAIAFGAATTGTGAGATQITWTSPTVSGSNTFGVVGAFTNSSNDFVTGATWNGATMTLLVKASFVTGTGILYIFGIVAPAAGATPIAVNASPSLSMNGSSLYYTGVNQSLTVDDTNTNSAISGSASFTISGTTIADNAWVVSAATDSSAGNPSAMTTGNLRATSAGWFGMGDNGPKTPAGTLSTVYQLVNTTNQNGALIGLAPFTGNTATANVPPTLLTLQVG